MYNLAGVQDGLVADHMSLSGDGVMWNPLFRRILWDWELQEADLFFEWLRLAPRPSVREDSLRWQGGGTEAFSVKGYYSILCGNGYSSGRFPWKNIWKVKVPSKVRFSVWTAARQAILMLERL